MFDWSEECERSFQDLKKLLTSEKVLVPYDVARKTRLYVDHGPDGLGATVAQAHEVDGVDHEVWRPIHYNSRALTKAERNYGKVEGESLGILFGILSNKQYLYGTKFEVVVDHLPLVSLYNSNGRDLPVRVAKHKSKLRAFKFKVVYEPGTTNPADYGSRHPHLKGPYTRQEKEKLGVEDEEEDVEITIHRVEELTDTVTMDVLKHETKAENEIVELMEDIGKGKLRDEGCSLNSPCVTVPS